MPAIGREFTVNQLGENWQQNPDITRLANGNFVVTWDSFYADYDADFDTYYIAGRIYSPTGAPLSNELLLSDGVPYSIGARVDALAGGGFAISWQGNDERLLAQNDIWTATFDAAGRDVGPTRMVSLPADEYYYAAETVRRADGGYTVLWTADEVDAQGTFRSEGVYARSYDAFGRPVGPQYHVNVPETADQKNPRAVLLSNGNIAVAYDSEFSTINPQGNPVDDLRVRILDPLGRPIGPERVLTPDNDGVSSTFDYPDTNMSIDALSGGRFVATWYKTVLDAFPNGDTGFGIFGRIFGPDGTPRSAEFTVGLYDEIPDYSAVTALDGGGFAVAYSAPLREADWPYSDVWVQLFSDYGVRVGGPQLVNERTDLDQEQPAIEALPGGGFVIAFESEEVADGDHEGIAARIFSGLAPGQADLGAPPRPTQGPDDLLGTAGPDRIDGLGGNDRIAGGGGNDVLAGGTGADSVSGDAGNDALTGGTGSDTLVGGDGNDTLAGNDDNDVVRGAAGNDTLDGGVGVDVLFGNSGNDLARGGAGADTLVGASGVDRLFGDADDDVVRGQGGNDSLLGDAGDDGLYGGDQADMLDGGAGADRIDGGTGADRLRGGTDADTIVTGEGPDRVLFGRGDGRDTVVDFANNIDTLQLDDALWVGDLTAAQVVSRFAEDTGADVVLRFGVQSITLEGFATRTALADDLAIV